VKFTVEIICASNVTEMNSTLIRHTAPKGAAFNAFGLLNSTEFENEIQEPSGSRTTRRSSRSLLPQLSLTDLTKDHSARLFFSLRLANKPPNIEHSTKHVIEQNSHVNRQNSTRRMSKPNFKISNSQMFSWVKGVMYNTAATPKLNNLFETHHALPVYTSGCAVLSSSFDSILCQVTNRCASLSSI